MDDSKPCPWCTSTSHTIDSNEDHIEKLELEVKNLKWLHEELFKRSIERLQANIGLRSENLRLAFELTKQK